MYTVLPPWQTPSLSRPQLLPISHHQDLAVKLILLSLSNVGKIPELSGFSTLMLWVSHSVGIDIYQTCAIILIYFLI